MPRSFRARWDQSSSETIVNVLERIGAVCQREVVATQRMIIQRIATEAQTTAENCPKMGTEARKTRARVPGHKEQWAPARLEPGHRLQPACSLGHHDRLSLSELSLLFLLSLSHLHLCLAGSFAGLMPFVLCDWF